MIDSGIVLRSTEEPTPEAEDSLTQRTPSTSTSTRLAPRWRRSTAVGREAEVAAGVELGVQRRAAGGEVLDDVGDRGEAAAVDVLAREDLDRDLAFEFGLLDAGTGDGDRVQRARLRGVGRRVLRRG